MKMAGSLWKATFFQDATGPQIDALPDNGDPEAVRSVQGDPLKFVAGRLGRQLDAHERRALQAPQPARSAKPYDPVLVTVRKLEAVVRQRDRAHAVVDAYANWQVRPARQQDAAVTTRGDRW